MRDSWASLNALSSIVMRPSGEANGAVAASYMLSLRLRAWHARHDAISACCCASVLVVISRLSLVCLSLAPHVGGVFAPVPPPVCLHDVSMPAPLRLDGSGGIDAGVVVIDHDPDLLDAGGRLDVDHVVGRE